MMDLDQLRQILDLVREHDLAEFEVEHNGLRLKIRKDASGAPVVAVPAAPALPSGAAAPVPPPPAPAAASAPAAAYAESSSDIEIELAVVKSPIVGTFYRSPEPGAASFVDIGSTVKKGQVLCIIEAMKLMNEIESEVNGEVVRVYAENGQPVEYGQSLFAIKPSHKK